MSLRGGAFELLGGRCVVRVEVAKCSDELLAWYRVTYLSTWG